MFSFPLFLLIRNIWFCIDYLPENLALHLIIISLKTSQELSSKPGGGGGVLTYYGKRGSAALMGDFSAKSP